MTEDLTGKRIELISTSDPYTIVQKDHDDMTEVTADNVTFTCIYLYFSFYL